MNAVGQRISLGASPVFRRAGSAVALLVATSLVACGDGDVTRPPESGSLTVRTETTGFMKDDGYELLLNGESQGAIGADDEITLTELSPELYELDLGGVADNCSVESIAVTVISDATAEGTLTIECDPPAAESYTLRFSRERPNLEDGVITECPFSLCPTEENWDLWVYYNSSSDPNAVIRQNLTTGVEIAHLPGVLLENLTEAHYTSATFTTELVADAFDTSRVILIRSDEGFVYALGHPEENDALQTLTFDVVLIVEPAGG